MAVSHGRDDLQFEASHALCVTLFGLGKLADCARHALGGIDYCVRNEFVDLIEPQIFGSHDGRVCCKSVAALCDLLTERQQAEVWLQRALTFVETQGNDESKKIAESYALMFYVLAGKYGEAIEFCQRSQQRCRLNDHWSLRSELLKVSSRNRGYVS